MATDTDNNNFEKHGSVLRLLREAQSVETDVREIVREVHEFLDQKDGQWDSHAAKAFTGRPRYTLDKCNDLVDDIAGAIEQSDFDIQILPAGGDATKDLAKTYDGLIRNIQNLSDATEIYNSATRFAVRAGLAGWRVNQRWGDNNTFDQDLFIDPIADFVDRAWCDPGSMLQTGEDAGYWFVLTSMIAADYKKEFPEGKGRSVSLGDNISQTDRMPDVVVVGEILYKEKVTRRIVELSNRAVYVDNERYQKIKDELEKQGAVEVRDREREMDEVKTRIFDGDDWLTDVQDTVFELIPIVPIYANFSVRRKIRNYWGIVTKKMDAQRIYNYTESRKVEEGALAPLAKILVTKEQIGGEKDAWENLNVSSDPALPYEHQDGVLPPHMIGGAQINPGLEVTSQSMLQNLQSTAGIDQLPGQPLGLQSGLAVELKQNRGDTRNYKYTRSKQVAVCYTGKIMIKGAIPKTYDTKRQVRVINEDQSFKMVMLNDAIIDEESGERVEVTDLSKGVYDVTCSVSKSFKNRQGETVNSMVEVASIDPSIIEEGRDVLYKNMNAPGFDVLAERVRQRMVLSGQIPEDQMTDEEKEFIAEQPAPPPDPVAVALERQAEAEDDKIQISAIEAARKDRELDAKILNEQRDDDRASMKEAMEQVKLAADTLNTHADTMNKIREAMGLETISGPGGITAFIDQAAQIRESQAEQP